MRHLDVVVGDAAGRGNPDRDLDGWAAPRKRQARRASVPAYRRNRLGHQPQHKHPDLALASAKLTSAQARIDYWLKPGIRRKDLADAPEVKRTRSSRNNQETFTPYRPGSPLPEVSYKFSS